MRLTVGDLQKWLAEANKNDVVTISEGGDFINVGPAESGMSIWVGDDEDNNDDAWLQNSVRLVCKNKFPC